MTNQITLSKERKNKAIEAIKLYFLKERDEDLGDLAAILILDFMIEAIGPSIYNQGLHDAIAFYQEKAEDIYGLEK